MRTYRIQPSGSTEVSNVNHVQRFRSKTLRATTKAPFYVSNQSLRNYIAMPIVHDAAETFYRHFNLNLQNHVNPLVKSLASGNIM